MERVRTAGRWVEKYLGYLAGAFLIRVVDKVDQNARRLTRKTSFKAYLTNPGLRAALFSPVAESDKARLGNLVETAVFAQWLQRDYVEPFYASWREGRSLGEVDLVAVHPGTLRALWCVEIKWSDSEVRKLGPKSGLIRFAVQQNLSRALLTTRSVRAARTVEGVSVTCVPSAEYAYAVGQRTIAEEGPVG